MLKERKIYLDKLVWFKDTSLVKVITGLRRTGKSSLLKLMIKYLKNIGVNDEQIIQMNFESYIFSKMTSDEVYNYVKEKINKNLKTYIFLDEIQKIFKWEEVVNAFRVDFDCDIYITGSNAYLLSSEYATYLSGRCIEIKMQPLSFLEFLDFNDFVIKKTVNELKKVNFEIVDKNSKKRELKDVFELYLRYGGMPQIAEVGLNQEKVFMLLDSVFSTVVVKDILDREKNKGNKLNDVSLLKKITMYLADNVGNNLSVSNVGNVLYNEKLIDSKPSVNTVQSYIISLLESYFFYEVKRFDIKGKQYLRTLGKYYISDIGFRNYLLGYRGGDIGHLLENIVYFELLRRGYDVCIGKIDNLEIDFIATNSDEKIYIQVSENMLEERVIQREILPLTKIKDNYDKMILTLNEGMMYEYEGVKVYNIIKWLLKEK